MVRKLDRTRIFFLQPVFVNEKHCHTVALVGILSAFSSFCYISVEKIVQHYSETRITSRVPNESTFHPVQFSTWVDMQVSLSIGT